MQIPNDELRRMLEQTLIPPVNVVELDPNTVEATTIRFGDVHGNLAEHYQINSCLGSAQWNRLADKHTIEVIQDFFFRTAQDGYDELLSENVNWVLPLEQVPDWVKNLIGPLVNNPAVMASLFSCDLLLAFQDKLWRLIPGRSGFQFEGTWCVEYTQSVQRAARETNNSDEPIGIIFISANIVRTSYLLGDRAFRAAAIGCGVILGFLWAAIGSQPPFISFRTTNRFLDTLVNDAARCDGIERGVQIVGFIYPTVPAQPTE